MPENLKEADSELTISQGMSKRLGVFMYYSTDCDNSTKMAAKMEELATKYEEAYFLKIDVSKFKEIADANDVKVTPTFHFWTNWSKWDTMEGADGDLLEKKIKDILS